MWVGCWDERRVAWCSPQGWLHPELHTPLHFFFRALAANINTYCNTDFYCRLALQAAAWLASAASRLSYSVFPKTGFRICAPAQPGGGRRAGGPGGEAEPPRAQAGEGSSSTREPCTSMTKRYLTSFLTRRSLACAGLCVRGRE